MSSKLSNFHRECSQGRWTRRHQVIGSWRHPTKNTFKAIQSIFRPLEMHSEPRYKICFCSVILGELESADFSKLLGLQLFFPENFRCYLAHYEREICNCFIALSITCLNPRILGFLFPTKNSLTWGVKCAKSNFRKA